MKKVKKAAAKTVAKTATTATVASKRASKKGNDTPGSLGDANVGDAVSVSDGNGNGKGLPIPPGCRGLRFNFARTGPNRGAMNALAKACGVSQTMLSLVFAGKKTPPVILLVKIAGVLTEELRADERLGKDESISVDQILNSEAIRKRIAWELGR